MNKLILTDKQLDFLWSAVTNHTGYYEEELFLANYRNTEWREGVTTGYKIQAKLLKEFHKLKKVGA